MSPAPAAGLLSPSCVSRLCHAADTVVALEPIADDSPVFKLLPEPQRWGRGCMLRVKRLLVLAFRNGEWAPAWQKTVVQARGLGALQ